MQVMTVGYDRALQAAPRNVGRANLGLTGGQASLPAHSEHASSSPKAFFHVH